MATIGKLDKEAKAAHVAVIAGASSVPCLTSAFIDRYLPRFSRLESAIYGIAAAQATNRGLGTAAAILSYVGKPFSILSRGKPKRVFGWQGLQSIRYPELGLRLFGYCDIPDLELFPCRYRDLRELRFVAGREIKLLHIGTWLLSWGIRLGLVHSLLPYAKQLLELSFLFDPLGSDKSGFHMFLSGTAHAGRRETIQIFMIARHVHGPYIPCVPAILLAKRIAAGEPIAPGAKPCLDFINLDEIMAAIAHLDIDTVVTGTNLHERWFGRKSACSSAA